MIKIRLDSDFTLSFPFPAASINVVPQASCGDQRGKLASQGAAALLGAAVATILTYSLPTEALDEWGWRIPFLLGTLIVPIGIYLRRHLVDEPQTVKSKNGRLFESRYIRNWLLTVFSVMGMTVSSYIMIYYLPTYSIQQLGLPKNLSIMVALATSVVSFVMCPIYGAWSDKLRKRKPLAIIGRLMLLLLLYPAFWIMTHFPNLPAVMSVMVVLMLFYTMGSAPAYALMPESFPRHIRASYMASAYAVAVSLFGGTSQLVAAWLIEETGNKMAPAWYMIICVLVSLIAISFFKETGDKALD